MSGHDHHGHSHGGHGHGHAGQHHAPASFGRAFAIGITLNVAYIVLEVSYGVAAHSLALLADAGHNLGDVLGLAAAWGASVLGQRAPAGRYTYGLRRTSILAALANAVLLLVATGGIAWEAVRELMQGGDGASGLTVMAVAAAGIVVNGITAWLFMAGRADDLNIRGAFLHMAADALVSAGVMAAGGLILWTGWRWIDPAIGLLVSGVIVAGTWSLLRDSVNLSLDAVPRGIDPTAVDAALRALPGVTEVHDLHIWGLSTTEIALTAHLIRDDAALDHPLLLQACAAARHHGIGHATFQLESPAMANDCALRPDGVV